MDFNTFLPLFPQNIDYFYHFFCFCIESLRNLEYDFCIYDIKQGLSCSKFRSLKNGEVLGKHFRNPFIYKALRHSLNGFESR